MEDIVIQEFLILSWEESTLCHFHAAINAMFPEEDSEKNLTLAIEVITWLHKTGRIQFFSSLTDQEEIPIKDTTFLRNRNFWKQDEEWSSIWCITTDLGDIYYAEFENKFWESIEKDGFLRNGTRYFFTHHSFDALKKIQFRHVVRTLGMPATTIVNNLVKHVDLFSHTECIVDTKINLITDISYVKN
jgi:hypothetical protein